MRAWSSMGGSPSLVLRHDLQDLFRILFREREPFLREDRPDVVEVARHHVHDLHRVHRGHHGDRHELLDHGDDLRGIDLRERGRVGQGVLLLLAELAPRLLLLLEKDFDLRQGHVVLFHQHASSRAPEVLRKDDRLLRPAAEAHVDDVRAPALRGDGPGHPVEPVVRPAFLHARIDHDGNPLARLELLEGAGDRGEPALARGAAELLPRLLHDSLRGLDHAYSPSWTSRTSSSSTSHATPSRSARSPSTLRTSAVRSRRCLVVSARRWATRKGVRWAIGCASNTDNSFLSFASATGGDERKRTRYVFAARSSFRATTSLRVARTRPSTSTLPELLTRATTAAVSNVRRRGMSISRMNGRPRPSIRASTSSRPIPWSACPVPPVSFITSAATTSSTLVGYILPVPPHRAQPLPWHRRQGHRVCGMPRASLRYRPRRNRGV